MDKRPAFDVGGTYQKYILSKRTPVYVDNADGVIGGNMDIRADRLDDPLFTKVGTNEASTCQGLAQAIRRLAERVRVEGNAKRKVRFVEGAALVHHGLHRRRSTLTVAVNARVDEVHLRLFSGKHIHVGNARGSC